MRERSDDLLNGHCIGPLERPALFPVIEPPHALSEKHVTVVDATVMRTGRLMTETEFDREMVSVLDPAPVMIDRSVRAGS